MMMERPTRTSRCRSPRYVFPILCLVFWNSHELRSSFNCSLNHWLIIHQWYVTFSSSNLGPRTVPDSHLLSSLFRLQPSNVPRNTWLRERVIKRLADASYEANLGPLQLSSNIPLVLTMTKAQFVETFIGRGIEDAFIEIAYNLFRQMQISAQDQTPPPGGAR